MSRRPRPHFIQSIFTKNNYRSPGSTTQPVKISHKSVSVDSWWVCFSTLSLSLWISEAASVRQRQFIMTREKPVAFILPAMVPDIVWMAEWRRNLLRQQRDSDRVGWSGEEHTERGRKKKIDRHGLGTEWRREATSPSVRQPPCVSVPALDKHTTTLKQRHSLCHPAECTERSVTIYTWTGRGQFKHSHAGTDSAGGTVAQTYCWRRGKAGLVSITLSVWNPKSLLL